MISKSEILMGRIKEEGLSDELKENLKVLHEKLNVIRKAYGKPMYVSSGYRSPAQNEKISGAAKKSAHMSLQAVDFKDTNGDLRRWVLDNLELFQELGLHIEDFRWTSTWVHIQTRPASKRIFLPYADQVKNPPTNKNWNGRYDNKFDKKK